MGRRQCGAGIAICTGWVKAAKTWYSSPNVKPSSICSSPVRSSHRPRRPLITTKGVAYGYTRARYYFLNVPETGLPSIEYCNVELDTSQMRRVDLGSRRYVGVKASSQ